MANTSGVFKRGTVYWIRYSVGGKQVRESARTSRKEEATALLRKRQTEIFDGSFFPDKKRNDLTLDGLREMWLEAASGKKTIDHDRYRLGQVVDFLGARSLVASLTSEDIDKLKKHLRNTPSRNSAHLAPATVNRYLAVLKSALKLADRRGYRHRDPMGGVMMLKEQNRRNRICSEDEYKQLIENAVPDLRLAIVFGYWTGMRLGEIAGLKWQQIDARNRVLHLSRKETKEGDEKTVPLAQGVIDALEDWPRSIQGDLLETDASKISKDFSVLTRKLEIEDLRFHDLRHTAVTWLRRAGVDIMTIKNITGHKVLATLERYNKVSADDLRAAVEKAEKVDR
jgi:integrase